MKLKKDTFLAPYLLGDAFLRGALRWEAVRQESFCNTVKYTATDHDSLTR